MELKCKHCGTELAGYETFCPGCGRELPVKGGAGFRPDSDVTDDMTAYAPDDLFPEEFNEAPVIHRRTSPVRPEQPAKPKRAQRRSADEPAQPRIAGEPAQPTADTEPARPVQRRATARPEQPNPAMPEMRIRAERPADRQSIDESGFDRRSLNERPPQETVRREGAVRPAPVRRPAQHRPASRPQSLTGMPRKLVLGALAIVGVILLVLLGHVMFGGGEDRAVYPFTPVVDSYFTSVKTGNANTFIETRPDAYTTYLTTGTGSKYRNESDYRAQTAASLQNRLAGYEEQYGKIRSIEYELTEIRRYNHRCEALSGVLTGWYAFPENAVTDAYIVNGTYTVLGAKGSGEYAIDELLLIQIDGNWYFSPDAGSYWRAE